MDITRTAIRGILTRTSGYLRDVASHSAQPYRGCPLGSSLCGAGCYVRHNAWVLRGRAWGSFLEARENAAAAYAATVDKERAWARRARRAFTVFLSSSTEPFPPQERELGVTRSLLEAMLAAPPDALILQTHTHLAAEHVDICRDLAARCRLRVHVSIETDRERLPGLPPHASPIDKRFAAASALRAAGVFTVITVSPLLPIARPDEFFARCARCADAVVIDHFIEGDGSRGGARTLRTALPAAMAAVAPESVALEYREAMVAIARRHLPGRTGVSAAGFAGVYA